MCEGDVLLEKSGNKETLDLVKHRKTPRNRGFFNGTHSFSDSLKSFQIPTNTKKMVFE